MSCHPDNLEMCLLGCLSMYEVEKELGGRTYRPVFVCSLAASFVISSSRLFSMTHATKVVFLLHGSRGVHSAAFDEQM